MQQLILTKAILDSVPPTGMRRTIPVGGVPGLSVIIHPSGKKVFSLFYRANGKGRRYKIGPYPIVSIVEARQRAMKLLNKVADGADPARERKEARQVVTDTVETVGAMFLERYVKAKGLRSHDQFQRHLERYLNPRLGGIAIREVTRRRVIETVDDIAAKHGSTMARRTYATLRSLFRWAVRRDILPASVCVDIEMPGTLKRGTRVLSDAELMTVWRACTRLDPINAAYLRLLMLTGQRRREIAGLRRSEINEAERVAIIDVVRMKGGLSHAVPLSPLAVQLIASMPKVMTLDGKGRTVLCDHVFCTGYRGDKPINNFSELKVYTDRAVLAELQAQAIDKGMNPDKVEPMPRWTLHDLRRTVRTNLSKLGVSPEIAERVVAHLPSGIRAVYDHYQFLPEKRQALEAWAAYLTQIVSDTGKPVKLVHAA
jgi:integrase